MITRRVLLKRLSSIPVMGGLLGSFIPIQSSFSGTGSVAKRNLIQELGLRTFINAAGNYTTMTASLMPDEVMDTINAASKEFVMLEDVQDKVGEKIAEICHAEAAFVTAGCWSAMVLGTAGVLTGANPKNAAKLPFLQGSGMKSEVILQKSHANGYHHALTNVGVSLILVETVEELTSAINENTAMMWFLNREAPSGEIQHQDWVEIAGKHGIPTMIDIAADVPPVENLWKYNDMGFDLVAISGGKALCGPQSTGILMGKKELIAAARLNGPPRGGNIGRGHKVNKEEILGLYVAVEEYVNRDHDLEWKAWEAQIALIENAVKGIKGVTTEIIVPPVANHNPSLNIVLDPGSMKINGKDLGEKLRRGDPSIETIDWEEENSLRVTVFMLKPGQEKTVAKRLKEELLAASSLT